MNMKRQEKLTALSFIAPFFAGFLIFSILPILYALVISFMDSNSIMDMNSFHFAGLDNYTRLFHDQIALQSFGRSVLYVFYYVPGVIISSFILAILLNRKFRMRAVVRTMVFMPYVANVVAVAIVWSILLDPFEGPVNTVLKLFGIAPPMWLGSVQLSLPTVAMINVWQNMAFQTIVYLAAIQEVPSDLYEAASIDGASRFRKIWHITIPLVSPTTFFLVITSVINSFQNYASVRMLTGGGPGTSSRVISLNIYEEAFTYNRYSYASAQAIVLFLLILIVTILQWKGQKKWVHY